MSKQRKMGKGDPVLRLAFKYCALGDIGVRLHPRERESRLKTNS